MQPSNLSSSEVRFVKCLHKLKGMMGNGYHELTFPKS